MISSLQISADLSICIGTGDVRTSPVADSGWCFGKNDGFFLIANENNFDHKIQEKNKPSTVWINSQCLPFPQTSKYFTSIFSLSDRLKSSPLTWGCSLHSCTVSAPRLLCRRRTCWRRRSVLAAEKHILRCKGFRGPEPAGSYQPDTSLTAGARARPSSRRVLQRLRPASRALLLSTKAEKGALVLMQLKSFSLQSKLEQRLYLLFRNFIHE